MTRPRTRSKPIFASVVKVLGPRRAAPVVLAALSAGCGRSVPTVVISDAAHPPDAAAADTAADAGPRWPAHTRWSACGTVGEVQSLFGLAVSPDGRYLAAGDSSPMTVWDLTSGRKLHDLHSDGGIKPAFSRDSTLLALGGDGRYLFRVVDGKQLLELGQGAHGGCISWSSGLAISPGNDVVVLGTCATLEMHGFDGRLVQRMPASVWSPGLAYSPDGQWLATSGPELWRADGSARRWPADLSPGPPAMSLGDAALYVTDNAVSFSPDGATLLVSWAKMSRSARVFETSTRLVRVSDGTTLREFGGRLARRPSFSPDGAWIVAGGQLVYLPDDLTTKLDDAITLAAFLPDGRIAAADEKNLVRLYCP